MLRPVKVPAHVIAERKEHARKREMLRNAKRNREIAASMGGGIYCIYVPGADLMCRGLLFVYIPAEQNRIQSSGDIADGRIAGKSPGQPMTRRKSGSSCRRIWSL